MRTAKQNPALDEFAHLLPASGRYPAKWVDIFWSRNDDMKIKDLEVVFIPRSEVSQRADERAFWEKFAAYNSKWESDLGNSVNDWLQPDGLSPESIFGMMLRDGFASEEDLKSALTEFAHIEECEWARKMVFGYDDH